MNKRLEQSLHVMREMYDLGFPTDYPPLKELSRRLSDYVKPVNFGVVKLNLKLIKE